MKVARVTRLLPVWLLAMVLPIAVQAQFNYTINNGTLTITGYPGPGGVVSIPDAINGLPVTAIGQGAFRQHPSLTSVTIPDSVTSIGERAFSVCTGLTNVTIGNSVTSIGGYAFSGCRSLTSATLPDTVVSIGAKAFAACRGLTSVTIPDSVTYMGDYTFQFCSSLTNVTIGDSVTSIGQGAFDDCSSLSSVTIGNSVTSIRDSAFSGLSSLTSVTIGNSVTNIATGAFRDCTALSSVTIPNSVTSIGDYAFSNCVSLTSVTIPNSVTSIGGWAFSGCSNLAVIEVDSLNQTFSSLEGVLFDKSQATLIAYPPGRQAGGYSIPKSVTSIEVYAFQGCTSLTDVTIPNSVTSIPGTPFGDGAFQGCTSLTNVTIANSVTSIGVYAFRGCTSLTSVTIGSSVATIGYGAFFECPKLSAFYFRGDVPDDIWSLLESTAFSEANPTFYYLPGTTGWKEIAGWGTVLWNPEVQTSDASFGVRNNAFGFTITGTTNLMIVVEASTDLGKPVWTPVSTNTLTGGSSYFSDPQWTNDPARFYRLRSP